MTFHVNIIVPTDMTVVICVVQCGSALYNINCALKILILCCRTYSPLRQYTSDSGYSVGLSSLMLQRPSSSETNLRKVSMGIDSVPRPGSALGLLQGLNF